jgi:hypothetical protein
MAADSPARTRSTPAAIRHGGRVLLAAGAFGLGGQVLFYEVGVGINFPIAVGLLLAGAWLLRRPAAEPMRRDLWLAPAAIAFAAMAAVRADPTIVTLDALTALGLTGAALASFGGRTVVARPLGRMIELGIGVAGWIAGGAARAWRGRPPSTISLRRAGPALPYLRGLLIAAPIVLVFVALFSSADAVFARILDDVFEADLELGEIPGRLGMTAVLGWLAAGGLALSASTPPTERPVAASTWRLGRPEALTVLLAVDALFLGFVALQGAYLFGGLDTLGATGLTYAEYARRGFFELVAVAVLAGGLIVAVERSTRDRSRPFIGAAIGLAVLTGVVLVSAALRLRLYQEAYGWTELRLYVLATIGLLAVGLLGLVVALAADRVRWIGHVLIAAGLGIGLALSLIGPVRFITEQNVARVLDPSLVVEHGRTELDHAYAVSLGDDAVAALLTALPSLDEPDAERLRDALRWRLAELRRDSGLRAWQAWNLGRARALTALETAEDRGVLDDR